VRAVNLIPSEQRQSSGSLAGHSQGAAIAVLGLMVGLAVLALLYGMASHQVSSREAEATELQARAQQAQTQASRLAPYTSFVSMREQRAKAISTLVASRFNWPEAFQELARVLPASASLSTVSGAISATAATVPAAASAPSSATARSSSALASSGVTSATPPGSIPVFSISGCATGQAQVAATLERLRLITGVNEVNLQTSSKTGGGGSGSGSCPAKAAAFAVQVTFQPLPTPVAAASAAGGSTTAAADLSTSTSGSGVAR
jgi:Tfp pilus assembly protein PilN